MGKNGGVSDVLVSFTHHAPAVPCVRATFWRFPLWNQWVTAHCGRIALRGLNRPFH